jgi:uncharacterized protein YndB with AHSA1/START domain
MKDRDDGTEVRLEVQIAASPATVFALLTEAARMKTWLADAVEADCRPGGIFQVKGPRGGVIEGKYLEIIPNRKVVFTWGGVRGLKPGASTVEFHLEPQGRGTLLRLHHHGLPNSLVQRHRRGWEAFGLVKLKDTAEGTPPALLCVDDIVQASSSNER